MAGIPTHSYLATFHELYAAFSIARPAMVAACDQRGDALCDPFVGMVSRRARSFAA